MSSARKRASLRKAHAEIDALKQDLMLLQHHYGALMEASKVIAEQHGVLSLERGRLLAACREAADQIRRCDYTPARSTLLQVISACERPAEPAASEPVTYSYSTDDEFYLGSFDSPESAAADAFYNDPELESVSVGENRKHTAHRYVSADSILDDVAERAYDECGEASEDWLSGVMHSADLKADLDRIVGDWLQAQEPPNFWRVTNTRAVTRAELIASGHLDTDD